MTTWASPSGALGGPLLGAALAALCVSGCASGDVAEARSEPLAVAPGALRLQDMDGAARDVEAVLARGSTAALVFWQTWCESCQAEAPALVEAVRAHGDAIEFVGVIPGSPDVVDDVEVRATANRWGYRFPQVRDADMALTRALEVRGTPTIVVLGPGPTVLYRGHRAPKDWARYRGAVVKANAAGSDGGAGHAPDCPDGVCPLPEARP